MGEKYQQQLEALADTLVTPERYGGLALTLALLPGEEIVLPETNRVYAPNRPLPPDTERTLERLDRLGRLG